MSPTELGALSAQFIQLCDLIPLSNGGLLRCWPVSLTHFIQRGITCELDLRECICSFYRIKNVSQSSSIIKFITHYSNPTWHSPSQFGVASHVILMNLYLSHRNDVLEWYSEAAPVGVWALRRSHEKFSASFRSKFAKNQFRRLQFCFILTFFLAPHVAWLY